MSGNLLQPVAQSLAHVSALMQPVATLLAAAAGAVHSAGHKSRPVHVFAVRGEAIQGAADAAVLGLGVASRVCRAWGMAIQRFRKAPASNCFKVEKAEELRGTSLNFAQRLADKTIAFHKVSQPARPDGTVTISCYSGAGVARFMFHRELKPATSGPAAPCGGRAPAF
jgi:hypothetical protein